MKNNNLLSILFLFFVVLPVSAQKADKQVWLSYGQQKQLEYTKDASGNRIPDFSYCGYRSADVSIPDIPVKIIVPVTTEDATPLIQQALDHVASLPVGKDGFRGAVLLQQGEYKVSGQLKMNASGVVLRGYGVDEKGTRIIAAGKDRRTLIQVAGKDDRRFENPIAITDDYVPVNAVSFTIASSQGLKVGDKINVHRPSTKEWIDYLETEHFGGGITALGWKAGEHDIYWGRTITAISGNKITIDVPLTTALDKKYGSGSIIPYTWNGRISNIGIENISLISEYDTSNLKDEAHSWMAITIDNAMDVWVRNIIFKHFAGSAVFVTETGQRITVENCKSLQPVSEIGGQRRYVFFTMGQQCLFQRIYSEYGYHDFGTGFCAPGPNAFVQCHAELPFSFSGTVDSWASGVLFDVVNINGNALSYKNRGQDAQGAGWVAANSVFWQCTASRMDCEAPPTANNWAFGSWSEFQGNGYWTESNNHIQPRSLYYQQLKERLGDVYVDRADLLPVGTEASSSPSVEVAQELTKAAEEPVLTLYEWIDQVINLHPIVNDTKGVKIQEFKQEKKRFESYHSLKVQNGWLVRNDQVQTGRKHNITWWNGTVQPAYLKKTASPHLTRFVPGRTGTGLTDDIDDVTNWMKSNNILALDHNYGLWYDRRRDDHERIRRINGEVWPPFYEQPFARSGQGTAYDGLSLYDLTKYNDWYWMRLRQFAVAADENELVLLHQNYFQHNIIEAGAHWADSPWRPANNVNNTGFPEPAPYAGDKRIFLAEQFYDINHPVRRELHKAYIRQCLNNFENTGSVIQLISEEYTGPLHFVEFWLDVIAEWEKETGKKALIALSATKDVQDAILADPVRAAVVDIIDIRYWFYRKDGTTYAPEGGLNLAPRQHARLVKPGGASFESVYRAVSEYRTRYPEKAVVYYSDTYPQNAWASFMGGGSLACLPEIKDDKFKGVATGMNVLTEYNTDKSYVLGDPGSGYIIYLDEETMTLDLSKVNGKFEVKYIQPKDGTFVKDKTQIKGGSSVVLKNPGTGSVVVWLEKK